MNVRKGIASVIIIMLVAMCLVSQASVYAVDTSKKAYFGIKTLMPSGMGYSINAPQNETTSSGNKTFARIWNIVEYDSESAQNYKTDRDIYCLKAGAGTLQAKDGNTATYDRSYNMRTEKETLKTQTYSENLKKLATENITVDSSTTVSKYDAVLAAFDMFYIKGKSDRKQLIEKIIASDENSYSDQGEKLQEELKKGDLSNNENLITEDEIKAVQQAVIWYFTNYGEDNNLYDQTKGDTSKQWFQYSKTGNIGEYYALSTYNNSNSNTGIGAIRFYQVDQLYKYMIKTAIENASKYANVGSTSGAPAKITEPVGNILKYEEDNENYIVGPIKIENTGNPAPYNITFTVKNSGTVINDYKLLDTSKKEQANKKVEDFIGQEFYISVPKASTTTLTVDVSIKYNNTDVEIWTSSTKNDEQPLAIPTIKPEEDKTTLTVVPEAHGELFDLALRKYITKINGENVKNSRVPVIDETALQNKTATTATYKHRKNPLAVKTGDIVTYNITIYNEGAKAGRATKIVDQLPTGLKFKQVVSGNFEEDKSKTYSETETNTLNLIRKTDNKENLTAYTSGKPASETITIECEVTAVPDTAGTKILTNVAWISEEVQVTGEGDSREETITNEVGKDRDSQPGTAPSVTKDSMSDYTGNDNKQNLTDSNYYYKGQQDDDDFEKLMLFFDLKLVKRITGVNQTEADVTRDASGRITSVKDDIGKLKSVDVSKLNTFDANGELVTTADYKMDKNPVAVEKGDIVTYTFRIYNEGTVDGYAKEITEDVPEGLEFLYSTKTGAELQADTTLTDAEKEAIKFNQDFLWGKIVWNDSHDKIIQISSDYLSKENEVTGNGNLIKAFGDNDGTKTEKDLYYKEISVKFRVISDDISGKMIRNEVAITDDSDASDKPVEDRDSTPGSGSETWKKENSDKYYDDENKWPTYKEDDEDYDNVVLKAFDLVLRKFIVAVSEDETIEDSEYLKNEDGLYTRAPKVDTSKLNTLDEQGNMITTAEYKHTKKPVPVQKNDIVVYVLRVYNEGDVDGYAGEIKDHLPSYLEFVDGDFNEQYGWTVSEDGRTVTTTYFKDLADNGGLIGKAEKNDNGQIELKYQDVQIMCRVKEEAKPKENITNIADITEYLNDKRQPEKDRDSEIGNVDLPKEEGKEGEGEEWPNYKGHKDNKEDLTDEDYHYKGQQDDDDFEKVVIKKFDLALRKFITKVEDKDVTTRIPQVSYDKENEKIKYEHTKEPVDVVSGNTVTYTLRIFNEGETNGYAEQVLDDIPEGLEFLPDNETNKEYRWKMYRALREGEAVAQVVGLTIVQDGVTYVETTDVSEAEVIVTDYLSKEQGEARMQGSEEENPNLLKAFDKEAEITEKNPDNRDIKVAFKVVEPNTSDKIIENKAQISKDADENGDEVTDDDSEPGEWNDGEDDQDDEFIKLRYFDLALRKWVTEAIVIENGKQTVTKTGHDAWDDPEQVVKVELHRKKLNNVVVKFRYSIRVYNQGDIEGYAKEITDYVPQGLKFVAEDNPGWTDEGNNVISTRLLENTLLKPGESADVEVLLTWVNNQDNMGVKTNTAEISEDYNEYGAPDIDSTPDNKKSGEDDIDDAPVMLSISTGKLKTYFTLGLVVLITAAGGVVLIKKYVL